MVFGPFAKDIWTILKHFFPVKLHKRSFINPKAWTFEFIS
jgi:hypothetical protein